MIQLISPTAATTATTAAARVLSNQYLSSQSSASCSSCSVIEISSMNKQNTFSDLPPYKRKLSNPAPRTNRRTNSANENHNKIKLNKEQIVKFLKTALVKLQNNKSKLMNKLKQEINDKHNRNKPAHSKSNSHTNNNNNKHTNNQGNNKNDPDLDYYADIVTFVEKLDLKNNSSLIIDGTDSGLINNKHSNHHHHHHHRRNNSKSIYSTPLQSPSPQLSVYNQQVAPTPPPSTPPATLDNDPDTSLLPPYDHYTSTTYLDKPISNPLPTTIKYKSQLNQLLSHQQQHSSPPLPPQQQLQQQLYGQPMYYQPPPMIMAGAAGLASPPPPPQPQLQPYIKIKQYITIENSQYLNYYLIKLPNNTFKLYDFTALQYELFKDQKLVKRISLIFVLIKLFIYLTLSLIILLSYYI